MALSVDDPTLIDTILYYGLFIGAIFQIVCIMSVVFVPKSAEEKELDDHDQVVEPQEPNTVRSNKQPQDHSRNKGKRQSKKQR